MRRNTGRDGRGAEAIRVLPGVGPAKPAQAEDRVHLAGEVEEPRGPLEELRQQGGAASGGGGQEDDVPDLRLWLHCGGGGMKSRMKRADRSGAGYALILGDAELEAASIVMKPLRSHRDQETVPLTDLPDRLRQLCGEASQE